MNKRERIVLSAYTGILMTKDLYDCYDYFQEILGRPFMTHEMSTSTFWEILKEKSKNDFLKIMNSEE